MLIIFWYVNVHYILRMHCLGESLNFNTILCERDKLNQFFLRQSKLFRFIYFDFEVPVCRLWVNLLTLSR